MNREQRRLVRALRPAPVYRPSLGRALAGWLWRHLPELATLGIAVWAWRRLAGLIGPAWTLLVVAAVAALLLGWARSRRAVLAAVWCVITRHRLHAALVEVRTTTREGRLPLFLLVRPAPFGERVWLWCRAGISAEDIDDESDRLRAALWARDVRVTRGQRSAALVVIDVIRRDPLAAAGQLRSPLLDHLDHTATGEQEERI